MIALQCGIAATLVASVLSFGQSHPGGCGSGRAVADLLGRWSDSRPLQSKCRSVFGQNTAP